MMGHSFGGIVMENALHETLVEQLAHPIPQPVDVHQCNATPIADGSAATFADLVVFVNSAAGATDAEGSIDRLAKQKAAQKQPFATQSADETKNYPLIISLSSSTDQATISAITIGHGPEALGRKITGRSKPISLTCYEPENPQGSQSWVMNNFSYNDYFLSTAPHFQPLQSHELKLLPLSESKCQGDLHSINPAISPKRLSDSFGPVPIGGSCYAIVPKSSQDGPHMGEPVVGVPRCNGTPYFVMEVPHDIIPDHGTIFTQRHWELLSVFLHTTANGAKRPDAPQQGLIQKRVLSVQ